MSSSVSLANGALILVVDAHKALFLVNMGDAEYPDLKVKRTLEAKANPRTAEQGSDQPGRAYFAGRHSKLDQTDWHQANEDAFADEVVQTLQTFPHIRQLIIVAPPKFLARMRKHLPVHAEERAIAEIAKDYTHLTVSEIEKKLLH